MKAIVTVSLWLLLLVPIPVLAQFDGVADQTLTTAWCTHTGAVLYTGDFNGDGASDLLCRDPIRFWIDYADSAGRLAGATDWFVDSVWCTHANSKIWLGDLNGDGRTDLLCKDPSAVWYDFADAEGRFGTPDGVNKSNFCAEAGATLYVTDFNRDRRADLLCRHGSTLRVDYGGAGAAGSPDLTVGFEGLGSEILAGRPLGIGVYAVARNQGSGPAPGSRVGQSGYMIDVVLSTDTVVPEGFAVVHDTFREDTLLRGGRTSNTADLTPGSSARFSAENDEIPADTPPGRYHLCARIDPGQVVREADETNNVACVPVRVVRRSVVGIAPVTHAQTKLVASSSDGLTIDARGQQLLFPLTSAPLRFGNLEELASFARERLGAGEVRVTPRLGGTTLAFNYRSKQYGSSYWRDPTRGLSYAVTEAVLAILGGTTGQLFVGDASFCIDPDASCTGLPSYLVPLTTPTALSHVNQCAGDVCTQYHSFFNKFDLGIFRFARHGANTRIIRGSSRGSWRLVPCSAVGTVADPDEVVEAVRVTLNTGGDDLRGGSHVFMQLGLPDSFEQSLNNGAGWGGGTTNIVTIPLPSRPTASQIAWFGLRFHSGDCFLCTTDNWNLDEVKVELLTAGGPRAFLQRGGAPFLRFSGALDFWSLDTATTGEGMLCAERLRGVRLEVVASHLVKFVNEPSIAGPPRWEAIAIPGVFGDEVDIVETAYGGVSFGISVASDGTVTPAGAPTFSELEADGVCSAHRSLGIFGQTGNGNHAGAEAEGRCP